MKTAIDDPFDPIFGNMGQQGLQAHQAELIAKAAELAEARAGWFLWITAGWRQGIIWSFCSTSGVADRAS